MSVDKAVNCSGNDLCGDDLNLSNLQDALDIGQETGQQLEVSTIHSDQSGYHVRSEKRVWKPNSRRQLSLVQECRHLGFVQRTELMDEGDS